MDELDKAEKDPDNKTTLKELREMVLPAELVVTGTSNRAVTFTTPNSSLSPCTSGRNSTDWTMASTALPSAPRIPTKRKN